MFGATDIIIAGAVNQSVIFALSTGNLAITNMKLGYVRYKENDGTSFTEAISPALTELGAITTAHTDNYAKYLDGDASGGNYFLLRVDFPDAAFAIGKDKVVCNVYDDDSNVIAQRIFDLKGQNSIYALGAIWVDNVNGVSGTQNYVNGIPSNPCENFSEAKALAASLGFKRIQILNEGTQLNIATTDLQGFDICSDSFSKVNLGSSGIENCSFRGLDINDSSLDISVGSGYCNFKDCQIGKAAGMNLPRMIARECKLTGLVYLNDTGIYTFAGLEIVDDGAVLDFNNSAPADPGVTSVIITGFSGRLTIKNMLTTDSLEITGGGEVIFDSTCNSATATAIIRGAIKVTNSATLLDLTDNTLFKTLSPVSLDGGDPTVGGMLTKLADNNDGVDFNAAKHSLKAIRDRGDSAWLTGAGASGNAQYTTTAWTRVVGDNDGGVGSDTQTVNGSYYSTGEVNTGTYIEVDADFVIGDEEAGVRVDLWGFYNGGASHSIGVKAWNVNDSVWEPLAGSIPQGSTVEKYTFILSPNHTNHGTNTVKLKFYHIGGVGIPSHVFSIDKCDVVAALPASNDVNTVTIEGIDATDQIRDAVVDDASRFSAGDIALIKAKTDNLPHSIKKNTAINNFKFVMLNALTGDPMPGLGSGVTASRSLDNTNFTSMANSVSERGSGVYEIDIAAADNNCTTGAWKFTATGAEVTLFTFLTEA